MNNAMNEENKKEKSKQSDLPDLDINTNPIWQQLFEGEWTIERIKKIQKERKRKKKTASFSIDESIDQLFLELAEEENEVSPSLWRKATKYWYVTVIGILSVIICSFIIFINYKYDFSDVSNNTMASTLNKGDKVMLQKNSKIRRFNIVMVRHQGKTEFLRVIGMPGDSIKMEDDLLAVNHSVYEEIYLKKNYVDFKVKSSNTEKLYTPNFDVASIKGSKSEKEEYVPEKRYVLLGDNRQKAKDSRTIGFYEETDIIGTVVMRVMPFETFGPIE